MATLALTVAALAGVPSSFTRIVSRAVCTSSSVARRRSTPAASVYLTDEERHVCCQG